jgi:type I restriction enzyme, S subunit
MSQALPKDVPQTLRRWKRYPAYKDSGIEWLGEIPEYWKVKKLKFAATFVGGGTPSKNNPDYWIGNIPWVSPKDMKASLIEDSEEHINQTAIVESTTSLIDVGAVLLVVRSSILKHSIPVAINKRPVTINQDMKALLPKSLLKSEYLAYVVRGHQRVLLTEWSKAGATVESIEFELLANSYFPLPPEHEQTAIASFLDREIAKIDALIAKKERLIELLQEKRTAIISHTVTKGLDSTAPLKDSGVEWLGEIPEDWRVVTVRNLIRSECLEIQDGNHGEIHPRAEDYVEMGIPFLMANNIRNGKIDLEGCKYISEQQAKSLRIGFSQSGDVLLTHKGTLGETSIIPHNIKFQFVMLTPQVTYYRIKKQEIDKKFLYYYFQSKPFQERLKFIAGNQSTRDYVGLIAQKNFEIVLPYPYEQKVLASYLDRETAKIDALIAKIREGIEKLKEYRTALISATVTGKIDVRNEVAS